VADCCGGGSEVSASIKDGEFLCQQNMASFLAS
jgi:hypothetical protein